MISAHFQNKLFNIIVIQVYAPTTNAKKDEEEQFYEDLQELLELTPKKMSFSSQWIGMQKQEVKRYMDLTGTFGLEVQNEDEQSLTEFCQAMHWSQQTPSNNTRDSSKHGQEMVNMEIRLMQKLHTVSKNKTWS